MWGECLTKVVISVDCRPTIFESCDEGSKSLQSFNVLSKVIEDIDGWQCFNKLCDLICTNEDLHRPRLQVSTLNASSHLL